MSLPSAQSRRRLETMGIDVWVRRGRRQPAAPVSETGAEARIRLEAGSGDWLLLADERERTRYSQLLADIRGTLGAERCRFGKWSDSSDSGVTLSELIDAGVRGVLDFRAAAHAPESEVLVPGGDLEQLSRSAEARRALWQRVRGLLER